MTHGGCCLKLLTVTKNSNDISPSGHVEARTSLPFSMFGQVTLLKQVWARTPFHSNMFGNVRPFKPCLDMTSLATHY